MHTSCSEHREWLRPEEWNPFTLLSVVCLVCLVAGWIYYLTRRLNMDRVRFLVAFGVTTVAFMLVPIRSFAYTQNILRQAVKEEWKHLEPSGWTYIFITFLSIKISEHWTILGPFVSSLIGMWGSALYLCVVRKFKQSKREWVAERIHKEERVAASVRGVKNVDAESSQLAPITQACLDVWSNVPFGRPKHEIG